jgi:hypothetical protein
MECDAIKAKQPPPIKCPCKEAIKALSKIIGQLQSKGHAIILMIDDNQTPLESLAASGPKKYSIE